MATKQKKTISTNKQPLLWLGVLALIIIVGIICWSWQKSYMVSVCEPKNLKLSAGQQNGAAGTIYQHMALTNTGDKKCSISGFPTAFLYGNDGNVLGASAASRMQPAPAELTLAPNETANTVLGYPQAGNFNPGICSAAKSTTLKLFPPSATTPLEVPLEVAWCPGFSSTAMSAGN